MPIVKFASVCDYKDDKGNACQCRSSEYTAFPLCRCCGNITCGIHTEVWTVRVIEVSDRGTDVVVGELTTVECKTCLEDESIGPDEYCDLWEAEQQEQANSDEARRFAKADDAYGGGL